MERAPRLRSLTLGMTGLRCARHGSVTRSAFWRAARPRRHANEGLRNPTAAKGMAGAFTSQCGATLERLQDRAMPVGAGAQVLEQLKLAAQVIQLLNVVLDFFELGGKTAFCKAHTAAGAPDGMGGLVNSNSGCSLSHCFDPRAGSRMAAWNRACRRSTAWDKARVAHAPFITNGLWRPPGTTHVRSNRS